MQNTQVYDNSVHQNLIWQGCFCDLSIVLLILAEV